MVVGSEERRQSDHDARASSLIRAATPSPAARRPTTASAIYWWRWGWRGKAAPREVYFYRLDGGAGVEVFSNDVDELVAGRRRVNSRSLSDH